MNNTDVDYLIKKHLEGWSGLAKSSIEYYAESGKISGGLYLAIKEMLKEYSTQKEDKGVGMVQIPT